MMEEVENFYEARDHVISLPAEIWKMILCLVPPDNLPAVARVNRKFSDLVSDPTLWTELRVSVRKIIENPKSCVDKICWFTWLKRLELQGDLTACLPGHLAIVNNNIEVEHQVTEASLEVRMEDKIPEAFFKNIASHCARLRVLKISSCVVDQSYINQLSEGCPDLAVIDLSYCQLVGVGLSLRRFQKLRVFNMVDCCY